jgi:uncharacterized protein (UPF0335 family)
MQQIGDLILKDFLSSFETTINKKDLVIKALIERLEQREQELKEIKQTVKKISEFMEGLSN